MTRTSAFKADHGLQRQIQRAAVSVMSNIAEGFESQTHKQFVRYLYIAKASSGEVRSQLYICRDLHYISEETFIALSEQATNCSRLISGFIRYLETQSK